MRQETNENKMASLNNDCRLLVISHMPLAYAMAWRLKDCGVSLEDLRQEGCLGLCEAATRYNEQLGCRFATYASYWCRKMMLRAIHRTPTTDSLQDETYREPDEDDDILRIGLQRYIDDALQRLTHQERQVVRMYRHRMRKPQPQGNCRHDGHQHLQSLNPPSASHPKTQNNTEEATFDRRPQHLNP